ncbi:hypothetical protein CEXT_686121 [Caerostris extrusa]|uniref:Uncharacterized protein n=1 Tax=Caerostris extrusa TaxID=172846 RepID=A0AAV4RFX7_CAEEX|nr:hypothetical protein CEXT_686121 [Caerostris extrusa]
MNSNQCIGKKSPTTELFLRRHILGLTDISVSPTQKTSNINLTSSVISFWGKDQKIKNRNRKRERKEATGFCFLVSSGKYLIRLDPLFSPIFLITFPS